MRKKLLVSLITSSLLSLSSFASECVDLTPYMQYTDLNSTATIADITTSPLTTADGSYDNWDYKDIVGDGSIILQKQPYGNHVKIDFTGENGKSITKNIYINEDYTHTLKLSDSKFLSWDNAFTGDLNITINSTSCTPSCSDEITNGRAVYKYDNNGTCTTVDSDSWYEFNSSLVLFNYKSGDNYSPSYRYYDDDSNVSTINIYTSVGENFTIYPFYEYDVTYSMFPILLNYTSFSGVYSFSYFGSSIIPPNVKTYFEVSFDNRYLRVRSNSVNFENGSSSLIDIYYKSSYEYWSNNSEPTNFDYIGVNDKNSNFLISSTYRNGATQVSIRESKYNNSQQWNFRGYYHQNQFFTNSFTYQARYYFDNVSKDLGL